MKSMRNIHLRNTGIAHPLYVLVTGTVFLIALRLFLVPGYAFNTKIWDDEVAWIIDVKEKGLFQFLFYRDAPGYFVFMPRLIVALAQCKEYLFGISSLRLLVLVVQLLCFAAAASCVTKWKIDRSSWVLLFFALWATYIEDLNYAHNIGYLFIFPIYLLVFDRLKGKLQVPRVAIALSCLLIAKPITAVIVIALVVKYLLSEKHLPYRVYILLIFSILYLLAYILLPHRWDTPFNLSLTTLPKLLINLPWVIFTVFLPSISIGVMGVLRIFDLHTGMTILGDTVYLALGLCIWKYRHMLKERFKKFSFANDYLILFGVTYLLVYSAKDSFWIKYSPLFELDSPQFIWNRWSSVIPLGALLVISSIHISKKMKFEILILILIQWIVMLLVGFSRFRRYW